MTEFDMEAVMEIEHGFGKRSRKPVDDAAPKRPLSAYFLWVNKNRASVMKENSDSSLGEIAKILGNMWKKTSSSDRGSFENKAEKDKKTYQSKMEKYKKTSSYKKFQMEMLAWKIHETKKPFPKDQTAPSRSLSAYMLYGASVRSKIVKENPDMAVPEVMKEQGVWWKALSSKDRKPWMEKAESAKEKYQKKLARYMKTNEYQIWVTERDEYKKNMLEKRNKLMGIKKRVRSESKPGKAKKQKRSVRRSRTPKASKSRSASRKSSKRRSRTPKAPRKSLSASRSSSRRRSSRRRAARRSRTPKASKRKSSSRKASKRRARTPKAPKKSSRSTSRRSSRRRAARKSRTRKTSRSKSKSKSKSKSRRSSRRSSKRTKSLKRSRSARRKSSGRRKGSSKKPEASE